jgi:MFS family permease
MKYHTKLSTVILAPLSEINGRRPLFMVTGFLFLVFVLVTAVTPTFAGMLVARFLQGCASSTFSSTVGGVVADIYLPADRNTPMTLFTGAALFGTGLGPLVSGFIGENVSWRW